MKEKADVFTSEILGEKRRGRPPNPHTLTPTERQRQRRAKLAQAGVATVTLELSQDVAQGLEEYLKYKDMTLRAVVEKLVRQQILRKR